MSNITVVGQGTTAFAVNASVQPVAHASTQAGDYVLVFVGARPASATWGSQPAGWRRLAGLANHRVYAKIWETGDVIPVFTPVGTAAGDDVIGETLTLRGVEPDAAAAVGGADTGPVVQANAVAAQNIAFPAYDVEGDNRAVILSVWKGDDITTLAGLPSYTSGALDSSSAGNDAAMRVYYSVQTAVSDLAAGSLAATGGTTAVSSAIVFTLRRAATFTATEQDVWPPRVLLTLSDLNVGDTLEIYRNVSGTSTLVRGASSDAVDSTVWVTVDAELPFGVPVTYVARVNGVEYALDPVIYTLPGGKNAITDAISGTASEVVVQEWTSKSYERTATTFRVGGRNVVVGGEIPGFTAQLTLYTETLSAGEQLVTVLRTATQGVVQLRQGSGANGIDSYLFVNGWREQRYVPGVGEEERRLWVLDVTEVEAWAPELLARGYTYEDLEAVYTGLTYADLAADYTTYLQLQQAELAT